MTRSLPKYQFSLLILFVLAASIPVFALQVLKGEWKGDNSDGMYLNNCTVDFKADTIRNCAYVNSYLKNMKGNFYRCVFSGRASFAT